MVRATSVTFYRPVSVDDDARAKHTDNEPERVVVVRGALLHRAMTRVQTDLGVGDNNNWTYIGRFPPGDYPNSRWTAAATVRGMDRTFKVLGAAQGMGEWQIGLQET